MSFDNALQFSRTEGSSFMSHSANAVTGNEFTAPEVFRGKPYDLMLVDEYAAGVLMYHLLTKAYPYKFVRHKSDRDTYKGLKK